MVPPISSPPPPKKASPGWRELVRKVYEIDPLTCPYCGAEMKVGAFITNYVTGMNPPAYGSHRTRCPTTKSPMPVVIIGIWFSGLQGK